MAGTNNWFLELSVVAGASGDTSFETMLFASRLSCRAFGVRALASQALPITTVRVSNDGVNQRKFLLNSCGRTKYS